MLELQFWGINASSLLMGYGGGRRCGVAYEFSCSQYLSVIVEFQIFCDNELDGLLWIA